MRQKIKSRKFFKQNKSDEKVYESQNGEIADRSSIYPRMVVPAERCKSPSRFSNRKRPEIMVISHFIIENSDGIQEMAHFLNLKQSEKFNVPAANSRVGDLVHLRPDFSGKIIRIRHEFYDENGRLIS